jgi:pyruvate ferredoxin oxidoreductase gamma subunit
MMSGPVGSDNFAIRLHGRGGQGVVTAAELLATAAFLDGHEAQAFPSFGSERMGAPVAAYCRISDVPIRVREPIGSPDAILVVDATLLHQAGVLAGLRPGGYVLINSVRSADELGVERIVGESNVEVRAVPATDLAREFIGRAQPNVCLLGAFAALTGRVTLGSLATAVRERFPRALADANLAAAKAAFASVSEASHA